MRRFLLLAAVLLCVTFAGCAPVESNAENLMQPPKLTEVQAQVDTALREAVGQEFNLKYPRNGEHRSAFNFLDLDSDGADEAIAFFSTSDNVIQIAMLRQTNDSWQVFDILPGQSFCTEIDFVRLQQLGSAPLLLVGWGGTGMANNLLAVYTFDHTIGQQGEVPLARNITKFYPPVQGSLTTSLYGAAVDCLLSNDTLCTVLLSSQNGQLVQLFAGEGEQSLYRQTLRTQKVFSCDLNDDGVIDIPTERLAEGYAGTRETPAYLTDYSNLINDQLLPVQTAYVSLNRGYRLLFPSRWAGHPISVLIHPDNNEAIFFLNTSGNLFDHSKELLRIQVYSSLDSQDKLAGGRYFQLATKGSYLYTAALPATSVPQLALTKNEVMQLFSLLS
ncbi:MAG: hypothetical protein RR022_01975 [Angelakisella sp.]